MIVNRLTFHVIASIFLLSVFTNHASALDKSEDIDTNRPSFMFSPLVVPKGSLQLENGGLYQSFRNGRNYFDASETQVRIGLTKRAEFQMFVPHYVGLSRGGDEGNRIGVTGLNEVGIKYQVGPVKKLQLSVIPSVNIPTGNQDVYFGKGVQGLLRAPWSYPLTPKVSIMGMQSILLLNSGRSLQYEPTLMLTRAVGSRATVFSEYAGFFTQGLPCVQFAHFGAWYKVKPHHQFDMHFGFGLDKTAPTAFIGTGYSYRFDKLPW